MHLRGSFYIIICHSGARERGRGGPLRSKWISLGSEEIGWIYSVKCSRQGGNIGPSRELKFPPGRGSRRAWNCCAREKVLWRTMNVFPPRNGVERGNHFARLCLYDI